MKEQVRVAVIGTGWWATAAHLPALRADSRVVRIALCDANPDRLAAAASAFAIPRAYADHRALLEAEKPDAVIVATTHATHFAIARDCLEAGAHVLVEKPFTLLAPDAKALVELAERRERALLVGYPWNYTGLARRARELALSGRIGPVQFVNCIFNSFNADLLRGDDRTAVPGAYPVHGPGDVYSRKEHSGGGHGHLQITHAAGLLFFATGLRLRSVRARMETHGLPLDLVDAMLAEFDGGALGLIGGTSNGFQRALTLQIYAANGCVTLDMLAGTGEARIGHSERETWGPEADLYPRHAPAADLVAAAQGQRSPFSTPEAGWRAVELLDAAYRSAEAEGRPVTVEELYRLS